MLNEQFDTDNELRRKQARRHLVEIDNDKTVLDSMLFNCLSSSMTEPRPDLTTNGTILFRRINKRQV
jgi:hypothetical protein